MTPAEPGPEPPRDCPRCPRLVAYRAANAARHPDWFNGAVPSFGDTGGRLLVLGLAPGVGGANRTGRPFTGDYAGELLYATLARFGLANGRFAARPTTGSSSPTAWSRTPCAACRRRTSRRPAEIATCRPFLAARLAALPRLRAVVCLGRIAHETLLRTLGRRLAAHPFAHGARHDLGRARRLRQLPLLPLQHEHRPADRPMFEAVFAEVRRLLD